MAGKQVAGDNLAANLAGMSKNQLYDIMCQMKSLIQQNQHQARQILIQNPLLTKALFQAQIMLGMVQPSQTVPNIQPQSSQQAAPPVQKSNTRVAHPTPSQLGLQDQANVSQGVPQRKQQPNQPPVPISSALVQRMHPQSVPPQPVEQSKGHMITQISHPQSSQIPGMGSLPLHSGSQPPSVQQPPMLPMPGHLQQAMQTTGVSHHMLQPPLPPQPSPPIQMQYQPSAGPNVNFQNAGIPQMHHSQPPFHSGNRPSGGMGPFSQGPPPFTNQPPHQPMFQGGGTHVGTDYSNQSGSTMQMERGSTWPPTSRENKSGAQLPALPPLAPGLVQGGSQARPPPLTPDVEQALLQQVMSLTPEQINLLPPEQRNQVLQLQQMLRQ